MNDEKKQPESKEKKKESSDTLKPDPGTTNTTDPQEHMEGPVSSLVKGAEKKLGGGPPDEKKTK
jgi:hypothetical protein